MALKTTVNEKEILIFGLYCGIIGKTAKMKGKRIWK